MEERMESHADEKIFSFSFFVKYSFTSHLLRFIFLSQALRPNNLSNRTNNFCTKQKTEDGVATHMFSGHSLRQMKCNRIHTQMGLNGKSSNGKYEYTVLK